MGNHIQQSTPRILNDLCKTGTGLLTVYLPQIVLVGLGAASMSFSKLTGATLLVGALAGMATTFACRKWPVRKAFATIALGTTTGLVAGAGYGIAFKKMAADYRQLQAQNAEVIRARWKTFPVLDINNPEVKAAARFKCMTTPPEKRMPMKGTNGEVFVVLPQRNQYGRVACP